MGIFKKINGIEKHEMFLFPFKGKYKLESLPRRNKVQAQTKMKKRS